MGAEPPVTVGYEGFFLVFGKKAIFSTIGSHFALIQSHLEVLDFEHLKAHRKD